MALAKFQLDVGLDEAGLDSVRQALAEQGGACVASPDDAKLANGLIDRLLRAQHFARRAGETAQSRQWLEQALTRSGAHAQRFALRRAGRLAKLEPQ